MTILVVVGGVLLLTIAMAAVAWPLLRRSAQTPTAPLPEAALLDPLAELTERRDAIYRAIKELEFDYQVGKVSEGDYRAFQGQLKAQAAAVLREIDQLQAAAADPALDAAIEAQVAALRRQPDRAADAKKSAPQARRCPRCGRRAKPEDRFCSQCGTPLQRSAT